MEEEKRAQAASANPAASAAPNVGDAAAVETQSQMAHEQDADEKAKLIAEIEELRSENQELKDKSLRLMAEMENLRRRTERDKAEFSKFAISDFARELLVVGDNLRRAIEAVPKDGVADDSALSSLVEGVEVTERELQKAFEKQHVTRFNPLGEAFNPHLHDAMTRIDAPNVAADTVVQVIQAGYMIGERVLRPAAVIVAKGGTNVVAEPEKVKENPNIIPPGATKVPEEVQAAEDAADAEPPSRPSSGVAASGREFHVERRRPVSASVASDDRRRQRTQPPPPNVEGSGRPQSAVNKPSTLHKPVINSGNE
jgi:molecular chaperone GrpE